MAWVPASVLTPGCRCGWTGTSTNDHAAASYELRKHGLQHVDAGEWPPTYLRDDGDVEKVRERLDGVDTH
jgi:hypothetical protein